MSGSKTPEITQTQTSYQKWNLKRQPFQLMVLGHLWKCGATQVNGSSYNLKDTEPPQWVKVEDQKWLSAAAVTSSDTAVTMQSNHFEWHWDTWDDTEPAHWVAMKHLKCQEATSVYGSGTSAIKQDHPN